MRLKRLGTYTKPQRKTQHDLSEYSVDESGQIWTNNNGTYVTAYGRDIAQGSGKDATATLRDKNGAKVSIVRKKLQKFFYSNSRSF